MRHSAAALGRCHLRLQSWYPFTVDVCLNGRAWLARQLDAEGLAYCRADNCFVALQDPGRAQALADAQLLADWPQLLQELLRQAHPLHARSSPPCPLCIIIVPRATPKLLASPKRGGGNDCAGASSTYPAEPRSVEWPIGAICKLLLLLKATLF